MPQRSKAIPNVSTRRCNPNPNRLGGQCHRLRNEAAHALYKEQEIGKQTRQALMENDALSRTVERLQKSFATGKASEATNVSAVVGFLRQTDRAHTSQNAIVYCLRMAE